VQQLIPDVDFHQNHYARLLDRELQPQARWLDIGAGTRIHNGFGVPTSEKLASRCMEVIGVDLQVEHLRKNIALTSFVAGSAESIPFEANRFDFVSANMVLEHLEYPDRVFAEVARVLVPGGKFVFVTPNKNHPLPRFSAALLPPAVQKQIAHRIEGRPLEHIFPTFYRANTKRDISRLAMIAHMRTCEISIVRNIPYFNRPASIVWLECHFIRASRHSFLSGMGADILGCLTKE